MGQGGKGRSQPPQGSWYASLPGERVLGGGGSELRGAVSWPGGSQDPLTAV